MKIERLEPLQHTGRVAPGERGAGRCHSCHGATARWLISFSRHREHLKLCANCAQFLWRRFGELLANPSAATVARIVDEDNRGNR